MKPQQFEEFTENAAAALRAVLAEMGDAIQTAALSAMEESQENGSGKAAISIRLGLKWDLSGGRVIPSGAISTAYKIEGEAFDVNPDPDQLKLGLDE